MKTLPLLCILACSLAQGEILPEPNVVMQSVVFDKKPDFELDGKVDCPCNEAYGKIDEMMRKLMNGFCPQSTRYKREDSSYPGLEALEDKTIQRLLSALEELQEEAEKNPEEVKEGAEDTSKTRLGKICRKGGKWHKKIEEFHGKRKKGDIENYKQILKDNLEDLIAENKDLENKLMKLAYTKRDWKEELERRRLKDNLAESWPRESEDRQPEEMYIPMSYHHHQPSHHRGYPLAGRDLS